MELGPGEERSGETLQEIEPCNERPHPDITAVSVINHHGTLKLTFADGLSGEVDVLDRMRGPVFDGARTPEGLKRAAVDGETGTVVWPGGADLAPDTLYERVRSGVWPESQAAA